MNYTARMNSNTLEIIARLVALVTALENRVTILEERIEYLDPSEED